MSQEYKEITVIDLEKSDLESGLEPIQQNNQIGLVEPMQQIICRICKVQGEQIEGKQQSELINPCNCIGDRKYVHKSCIINECNKNCCFYCIHCNRSYNLSYLFTGNSIIFTILIYFIGSLFLVAANAGFYLLIYIAITNNDKNGNAINYSICLLISLVAVWFLSVSPLFSLCNFQKIKYYLEKNYYILFQNNNYNSCSYKLFFISNIFIHGIYINIIKNYIKVTNIVSYR